MVLVVSYNLKSIETYLSIRNTLIFISSTRETSIFNTNSNNLLTFHENSTIKSINIQECTNLSEINEEVYNIKFPKLDYLKVWREAS